MKSDLFVRGIFCLVLVLVFPYALNAETPAETAMMEDFIRDDHRIQDLGQAADIPGLMRMSEEVSQAWKPRSMERYGALMVRICTVLYSDCSRDEIPLEEIREVARRGLETYDPKKSENISVESHYYLLGALQGKYQYLEKNTKGTLSDSAWEAKRKTETERWMVAWDRLETAIDPKWDPDDYPFSHASPPSETGLPPGIAPEVIQDSALRDEYEQAIRLNAQKAENYSRQSDLRKLKKLFTRSLVSYFSGTYSISPFADEELSDILTQHIKDAEIRKEILDALEEAKGPIG